MTPHRSALAMCLSLVLGTCPTVAAQDPPEGSRNLPSRAVEGISVQDVSTVGFLELFVIAFRRALDPGLVEIVPLHAYPSQFVCNQMEALRSQLEGHRGAAALVVRQNEGDPLAFYYRSATEALEAADEERCQQETDTEWWFGTTVPVPDGVSLLEDPRVFVSRDVESITSVLRSPPSAPSGDR